MDPGLLTEGIEHIKSGQLTMRQLMKVAIEIEKNSAQIAAITACIVDGTVFTKQEEQKRATVKELVDYAELHYVLRTMKDAAKEITKAAERALSGTDERAGNDGHTQRFAERLREAGLTSFKIEDLGSFFIKTKSVALPPKKTGSEEAIEAFTLKCKAAGLDLDDPKTTLAAAETIARETDTKIPPYLAFKLYIRAHDLSIESWNWQSLQSHVQEVIDNGGELPEYIHVMKREEVQFRKS